MTTRKQKTRARVAKIRKLRAEDMKWKDIAKVMKLSMNRCQQILKNAGPEPAEVTIGERLDDLSHTVSPQPVDVGSPADRVEVLPIEKMVEAEGMTGLMPEPVFGSAADAMVEAVADMREKLQGVVHEAIWPTPDVETHQEAVAQLTTKTIKTIRRVLMGQTDAEIRVAAQREIVSIRLRGDAWIPRELRRHEYAPITGGTAIKRIRDQMRIAGATEDQYDEYIDRHFGG